jgi:nucleotidyltransferase substrate binding protein (TIGR01987 family)
MEQDIRWFQRFENYKKAFNTLSADVELATERELSDIEKRGLIQAFEYTYELAWNVIRDFYLSVGEGNIHGSRDAFTMAFNKGLVNSEVLVQTIKSRQLTVHTYNEAAADAIFHDVINKYYEAFNELRESLQKQYELRKL